MLSRYLLPVLTGIILLSPIRAQAAALCEEITEEHSFDLQGPWAGRSFGFDVTSPKASRAEAEANIEKEIIRKEMDSIRAKIKADLAGECAELCSAQAGCVATVPGGYDLLEIKPVVDKIPNPVAYFTPAELSAAGVNRRAKILKDITLGAGKAVVRYNHTCFCNAIQSGPTAADPVLWFQQ